VDRETAGWSGEGVGGSGQNKGLDSFFTTDSSYPDGTLGWAEDDKNEEVRLEASGWSTVEKGWDVGMKLLLEELEGVAEVGGGVAELGAVERINDRRLRTIERQASTRWEAVQV
jgi:hypothetical protein